MTQKRDQESFDGSAAQQPFDQGWNGDESANIGGESASDRGFTSDSNNPNTQSRVDLSGVNGAFGTNYGMSSADSGNQSASNQGQQDYQSQQYNGWQTNVPVDQNPVPNGADPNPAPYTAANVAYDDQSIPDGYAQASPDYSVPGQTPQGDMGPQSGSQYQFGGQYQQNEQYQPSNQYQVNGQYQPNGQYQANPYMKTATKRSRGPVIAIIAAIVVIALIVCGVLFLRSPAGRRAMMHKHDDSISSRYPFSAQQRIDKLNNDIDSKMNDVIGNDKLDQSAIDTIKGDYGKIDTENKDFANHSEIKRPYAKQRLDRYLKAFDNEEAISKDYLANAKNISDAFQTCGDLPLDPMEDADYQKYVAALSSCRATVKPMQDSKTQPVQQFATNVNGLADSAQAAADTLHSLKDQEKGAKLSPQAEQAMNDCDIKMKVNDLRYTFQDSLRKARKDCHANWKLTRLVNAMSTDPSIYSSSISSSDKAEVKKGLKTFDGLRAAYGNLDEDIRDMDTSGMEYLDADDEADLQADMAAIAQVNDEAPKLSVTSDQKVVTSWREYQQKYDKDSKVVQSYADNIVQVSNAKAACDNVPVSVMVDDDTSVYANYIGSCRAAIAPFKDTQVEPLAKLYSMASTHVDAMESTISQMNDYIAQKGDHGKFDDSYTKLRDQLNSSTHTEDIDSLFGRFGEDIDKQREKIDINKSVEQLRTDVMSL